MWGHGHMEHELDEIEGHLEDIKGLLIDIKQLLTPKAVSAFIKFEGGLPNMPGQLTDVQSITAEIGELDAAGQPVPVADPSKIAWTIGDPTIADLTVDASGVATFKAKAVGTSSVGVSDGSNGLSAQDALTVTAGAATSLVIKFGTPTP
jgi:hypothetical protein